MASKKLVIFDDSCEEILQLATAGRQKNVFVIFIKHNLYQQENFCATVDKNTTHVLLTNSPRVGKQLKILGTELECASPQFIQNCYRECMKENFGHFLIDTTTSCPKVLRFCVLITDERISLRNCRRRQTGESKSTLYFLPPELQKH